jgi:glycosyltransferase involved in cell wall biosynthesis
MHIRPSVSVILLSYNHEKFIGEALRSWFEQDYPEFELIIADDASTDRTRKVIEDELAVFKRPPSIRIVECHHAKNVGLLNNVNAAMACCSGDIIVTAAGDDIAAPSRLSSALEIFEANPAVFGVVTNFVKIDAQGRMLKDSGLRHREGLYSYADNDFDVYAGSPVCGATAAYRAELFHKFGPMRPGTHGEDNCYGVRALLLGAVYFDSRPLVYWRQHGANLANHCHEDLTTDEGRQRFLRFLKAHELMAPQWEADAAMAVERGWVDPARGSMVAALALSECALHALHRCSLGATSWADWMKAAWPVFRSGRWARVWHRFRLRLLPWKRERAWRRLAEERM